MKKIKLLIVCFLAVSTLSFAQKKPNILFITVDDTPPNAYSIYSHGMMYQTPNIDRIGKEGGLLQITILSHHVQQVVRLLF